MSLVKLQFRFQGITGLSKDRYVNTLYYTLAGVPTVTDYGNLATNAIKLWSSINAPETKRLSDFWSPAALAATGHDITMFLMDDPEPRAPVYQTTWVLPGMTSQNPYPAEVAFCLSFKANALSGANAARRRGRIYMGPLGINTGTVLSGTVRPSLEFRGVAVQGMRYMAAQTLASGWTWVVHSPTSGPTSSVAVQNCWVDDAFDTQRRRGLAPLGKLSFPIP